MESLISVPGDLMRLHRIAPCAAALTLLMNVPVLAGQVRVNLSGMSFTPATVTVNQGDHVVWVWQGGIHSVTSGTDGSEAGDGIFNSGTVTTGTPGANSAFSWKTDRLGVRPYYCVVHFPDMAGTITVQAGTSVSVPDFRITEVLYHAAGNLDLIEIQNMGKASGDLGRYRIAIPGDVEAIPLASVAVPSSAIVTIHVGASGTNTATDLFLPLLASLPDASGSVALYVPGTITGQNALTDASAIIDYVEYGSAGQANESTAATAGLWTAGEFVPTVGQPGRSIEFCGNRSDHGATHWAEISPPNFGTDGNCLTPAIPSTWGRIKALYR
jgi:plastocyanin